MSKFFRTFFASLLALVVFSALMIVLLLGVVAAVTSDKEVATGENAVLVINLADHFSEIPPADPIASLTGNEEATPPSLAQLVRLIRHAASDASIKGIYIKCEQNNNGFGSSEEIRNALLACKGKGKFIYAYANAIPQKAYYVANVADKIYCHPYGGLDWHGFAMQMPFIKNMLEKLEVEPQIFYAGKFKSATEPLRETQMTDANRLQSTELLYDMYNHVLVQTAAVRKLDTATLDRYADSNSLQFASAAARLKMVDGLRYDDEVKDELRQQLKIGTSKKINFVSVGRYAQAVGSDASGSDKIVVIYAEGTIIDGNGDRGQIGGDTYRNHIRKAREDNSVKAIVLRINSGGGSAMASEVMWREVELARKVKPVIVSFGDVAASGGYYMACAADSIFAQPTTITGSIGVFGVLPNMQKFFNNKLGITFDEVKTSPDATLMSITKPLSPVQRQYIQHEIDTIYNHFKYRVAQGRKKPMAFIDSIAQGRVWSGTQAVKLGLVDRLGGLDDAIAAAAARAKLKDYRLREYPGEQNMIEMLLGDRSAEKEAALRKELGVQGYQAFCTIRSLQQMTGTIQARMPFDIIIE